jgi:hypothetical protein
MNLGFEIAIGIGRGKVIDVPKLPAEQIMDSAFDLVSWEIRHEIRKHVEYLKQVHGNKVELADRNEAVYSLARTDDSTQVLLVSFDSAQRHIAFEKTNDPTVNYLIRVVGVSPNAGGSTAKANMTHRKYGQELGELTTTELPDLIRHCIEVATELKG